MAVRSGGASRSAACDRASRDRVSQDSGMWRMLSHLRHQEPFDQLEPIAFREDARLDHCLIFLDTHAVK